jgi:hypothetical protein
MIDLCPREKSASSIKPMLELKFCFFLKPKDTKLSSFYENLYGLHVHVGPTYCIWLTQPPVGYARLHARTP